MALGNRSVRFAGERGRAKPIARWSADDDGGGDDSSSSSGGDDSLLLERLECSCFPLFSALADLFSRSRHEPLLASGEQKAVEVSSSLRNAPSFPPHLQLSLSAPSKSKSIPRKNKNKTIPGSSRAASSPGWARASRPHRSACCSRRAGTG